MKTMKPVASTTAESDAMVETHESKAGLCYRYDRCDSSNTSICRKGDINKVEFPAQIHCKRQLPANSVARQGPFLDRARVAMA